MTNLPPPTGLQRPQVEAPTEFHAHPGEAVRVGCPMCGDMDNLVIDVPTTTHHKIEAWAIPGTSEPDYDIVETTLPGVDDPVRTVAKVRCVRCRWAYTGERPLAKLQLPRAD